MCFTFLFYVLCYFRNNDIKQKTKHKESFSRMKNYLLLVIAFVLMLCNVACDDECPPAVEACTLIPEVGPCDAVFPIYYYDQTDGICKEFIWGGCDGVVPFETLEACQECECNN